MIIATTIATPAGAPKIAQRCTLPVSTWRRADLLVTEVAVFDFPQRHIRLIEVAADTGVEDIRARVTADFSVAADLRRMATD